MAGENELLEAEGIDPNAQDVNIEEQDTNDLTLPEASKTGNESLDKRLEELAIGTTRGNETAKASEPKQAPAKPAAISLNKEAQTQANGVQPQQRSPSSGGWAGKAPRAYGPRFNWDAQGNVIDRTTGGVIAAAGPERKAFERMIPIISAATTEADKFKTAYEGAIKSNTIASSLNLTPEEYSIGARIMAQWKSDPKKALAFMVKEAQNNGVDVSDLGIAGGVGLSRTDLQTVLEDAIKKHLEPFSFITSERQEQQAQREALQEAQGAIEEFYTTYPDATLHEDSLAKIMHARPGTSMETAYLILKNHALQNGFDWSKDLIPQIQAFLGKQQQPNGRANSNGQPAIQQRQLPNMNGRNGSPAIVPQRQGAMAGSVSSGDIVKEAMRAAGMDISDV